MAENLLSKFKVGDVTYNLKDAKSRQDLTTLIGSHNLEALGDAAWHAMAASISDGDGKIADAATVKAYVDAQVEAIPTFDVIVVTELPTASADTFHKIYLLKRAESGQNKYSEYITIRSGAGTTEDPYTYTWEMLGDIEVDLKDYLTKNATVAGVAFGDDKAITADELKAEGALDLKALSHKDSAEGTIATADSANVAAYTPEGTITLNDLTQTATAASLTKGDYTPAGSITGSAIKGGSINVTLKDAATATEASLTTATYTPTGTVAAVEGGSFAALKSATFGEDENGVQVEGDVSAPTINLTSAEKTFLTGLTGGSVAQFSEGTFTPASIADGFFNAGATASYSHTGFSGGSLGAETKSDFATEGMVAAIDGTDAEMLVISAAGTAKAVTAQGTFTAAVYGTDTFDGGSLPSIDTTKFDGGSKAADSFTANTLQSANQATVNNVTAAALANAPVFTGKKYKVATTNDTALKTVAFTATNSADIVNKVEYVKQDVDAKTFTPEAATLGFAGTTATQILVTGVSYDKATANGASFAGTEVAAHTISLNKSDKTVTVA